MRPFPIRQALDAPNRLLGYSDYRSIFMPLARDETERAVRENRCLDHPGNRARWTQGEAANLAREACLRPHLAAALAIGFVARCTAQITAAYHRSAWSQPVEEAVRIGRAA